MDKTRFAGVSHCWARLWRFIASGTNAADLDHAVGAAFAAMAQIHRLMSFHDPEATSRG